MDAVDSLAKTFAQFHIFISDLLDGVNGNCDISIVQFVGKCIFFLHF